MHCHCSQDGYECKLEGFTVSGEKRSLTDDSPSSAAAVKTSDSPEVKRRRMEEDDVGSDVVARILSTITEPKKMLGPDVILLFMH